MFSCDELEQILGPGGPIATNHPNYEYRPGQIRMAQAVWDAIEDVKNQPIIPVPTHLKDSHYPAAKKMGFGQGYKYPHNFEGGFVPQVYLSAKFKKKYYRTKGSGYEKTIESYLQKLEKMLESREHRQDEG